MVSLLSLLLFSTPNAEAFIYGGNPKLSVHAWVPQQSMDEGGAELDFIKLIPCAPGAPTTVAIDEVFDIVAGADFDVPSGDWCTAELHWTGTTTLDSSEVEIEVDASFSVFDVDDGTAVSRNFGPFEVLSGNHYGGHPKVTIEID